MTGIKRSVLISILLTFALALAACGNVPGVDDDDDDNGATTDVSETTPVEESAEPTPTPEPSPTPEPTNTPAPEQVDTDVDEILELAAERASELESARFQLDGSGHVEVPEIGEVEISNAEGVVQRPGQVQVDLDVDLAEIDVPMTVIARDGELYIRDVMTGGWQEAPGEFNFNPGIIFDDDDGIPALIRSIEDPVLQGTADLDGHDVYHITGLIDRELIETGTGGVFRAEEDVDFAVWIDQETHDVLLIRAEDPTGETESIWEMRISEHNEPVEIDDPTADS